MKKKILLTSIVVLALLANVAPVFAAPPPPDKQDCTTIQDGVLTHPSGHFLSGQPLSVGYDAFGYNYQAHLFSGSYANIYLGGDGLPPYAGDDNAYLAENPTAASKWYWPYRSTQVLMKWDQDWIANVDCDDDGKLDRHFNTASYVGSEAWETNHMWDSYEYGDQTCTWDYFTKIVAVPSDATKTGGVWYGADGVEIGLDIWGEFATIQSVYNDPCSGFTGLEYLSPDHAGFGGW